MQRVHQLLGDGYTDVVDADLSQYFDTIPHGELMQCVARRIVDGNVLRLIKMWLTVPVEEPDENGKRRLTGGQNHPCGTPQGGVISPLLANLYRNRLLKGWRRTKRGEEFQARLVSSADDFVILSRGRAAQALDWTRKVVARLGLTLNEAKTSIKQARQESFDFLGYTFGPHCFEKNGRWYMGASPSKKSVARIKQKVGDLLVPNNVEAWSEVRNRLNQTLRGWCAYFSYGTTTTAYRAVDYYVYESVRHYLRRRHQVRSRGTTTCFSRHAVYGRLGVIQLRRVRMGSRS